MKIIISPHSRVLRNGKRNPKDYPWWYDVVKQLKTRPETVITQVGVSGEKSVAGVDSVRHDLSFDDLEKLVLGCDTWAAVDNFFPHFCHLLRRPGVVLFGKSDPRLFGYEENVNLLKDRSRLRKNQYDIWETEEYDEFCFVGPEMISEAVTRLCGK
jgi:hypothetical protein